MRRLCLLRSLTIAVSTALTSMIAVPAPTSAEIARIEYEDFTLWIDCNLRGAVLFHYLAEADAGDERQPDRYIHDPDVPERCQAKSTDRFQVRSILPGLFYDVGQMVPANHVDGSALSVEQTSYWTNLWPMTSSLNRGPWQETNILIECLRDEVRLDVWGGPIIGSQFEDDLFVETHDMVTPSAFWKVVIRSDNREGIGWIIPNGLGLRQPLDHWIVPIIEIEKITGLQFVVDDIDTRPETGWPLPERCDLD